jgi:hypothetical protein
MGKVFSWVEIPVKDIERAARFYGQLLNRDVTITDAPPRRMATLYFEPNEVGGSLLQAPGFEPGNQGAHVYLSAGRGDELEAMIERVRSLGAEIIIQQLRWAVTGGLQRSGIRRATRCRCSPRTDVGRLTSGITLHAVSPNV